MKKINLMLLAIFTLILAGNAFGQAHPEVGRTLGIKAAKVKTTKIKSKKPAGFSEVSGLTQETERRKHPRRKSAQYNPKEVGIDKAAKRKNIIWGQETNYRTKPRKRRN